MKHEERKEVLKDARGTKLATRIVHMLQSPSRFADGVSRKLALVARKVDSMRGTRSLGIDRVERFFENIANRIPTKTQELSARFFSFMQRFNPSELETEKIRFYSDQGVSLDELQEVQATKKTARARRIEDWPSWILSGGGILAGILMFFIGPTLEESKKK
jgi:hypothetical protein